MCSKRELFPFPLPRENYAPSPRQPSLFLSLSGSVDCSVVILFYECSGGGWGWKWGSGGGGRDKGRQYKEGQPEQVDIKGESGDQVPWKLPEPWTRSLSTLTCGERLGYFIMQFERKSRESYKNLQRWIQIPTVTCSVFCRTCVNFIVIIPKKPKLAI